MRVDTPQQSAGKVLSEIAHPLDGAGVRSTGSDGALLGDFARVFDGTGEQQTERCHIACSAAKKS